MPSKDKVIRDPFDGNQNAYQIICAMEPVDQNDPECGFWLGWKSERQRNNSAKGWEGWEPLEYGDKYTGENGEKLRKYIPDPPMRMRGPDRIDNYVRRADTVLCRIPKDWFDARQANSARRSQEMVRQLEVPEGQEVMAGKQGVTSIGGGRKADKNPSFGI